jgi:type VI secretion system secreted protein Hcp
MATDMFLQIDGIKGESQDHKHKEEIDLESWSWGLSQSGTSHTGGGGGAGKVSVHDLSFTHFVDKASTALIMHCATGKHIKKALLTVRKAGEKPLEYFKMTLEDLLISGVQHSGSGGDSRVMENVTLNFAKFQIDYQIQKPDGTGSPAGDVKWDVKANTKY